MTELQSWTCSPGSGPPSAKAWRPIAQDNVRNKPRGGLWTSTWDDAGSDWLREAGPANMDLLGPAPEVWLLTPEPAANVLTIDGLDELVTIFDHGYGIDVFGGRVINFQLLAQDYDAVHLTEKGQWATRLSWPDDLYGWDCECTLWLRWRFTDVQRWGVWDFIHKTVAPIKSEGEDSASLGE